MSFPLCGQTEKDLPFSSWVWWFSYLVPVGETLTSDLHHHPFKFWKSNKCKAGIMTCQGMGNGWNHFSSIYGKPCMFKSLRHLVTKNISVISSYASLHVWICTWNSLQMAAPGKEHPIWGTLYPFQIL